MRGQLGTQEGRKEYENENEEENQCGWEKLGTLNPPEGCPPKDVAL